MSIRETTPGTAHQSPARLVTDCLVPSELTHVSGIAGEDMEDVSLRTKVDTVVQQVTLQ